MVKQSITYYIQLTRYSQLLVVFSRTLFEVVILCAFLFYFTEVEITKMISNSVYSIATEKFLFK